MTNAAGGSRTLSILRRARFAAHGRLLAALDREPICERTSPFEVILPGT